MCTYCTVELYIQLISYFDSRIYVITHCNFPVLNFTREIVFWVLFTRFVSIEIVTETSFIYENISIMCILTNYIYIYTTTSASMICKICASFPVKRWHVRRYNTRKSNMISRIKVQAIHSIICNHMQCCDSQIYTRINSFRISCVMCTYVQNYK